MSGPYKLASSDMPAKKMWYLLKAPPRTLIGREEFKKAGLLPLHLRVEQLKLNHMFNIVNGQAPKYLGSNVTVVPTQHRITPGLATSPAW